MSRVTFALLCPSIRCSARTFTPADTASDAHVCLRSCGVTAWMPAARVTEPVAVLRKIGKRRRVSRRDLGA